MKNDISSDNKVESGKKSSKWINALLVVVLLGAGLWLADSLFFNDDSHSKASTIAKDTTASDSSEIDPEFLKSVVTVDDSTAGYIRVSDPSEINSAVDANAGDANKRIFTGRRINIAITGVDSRLGDQTRHADANHVVSILIDSGKIEIYSVPRDTPVDLGMPDSSGLNKLTICRASKGRDRYLQELAKITRFDRIHYFAEFGFSQAMGILEFLGYGNAKSTLQVLRSRKGLGGDDYQRCYNQGQFIRQTILRHIGKLNGAFGGLILRGGLAFVETNLTADIVNDINSKLRAKGFPNSAGDITNYVRPAIPIKFKVYDFTDKQVLAQLQSRIEGFNQSRTAQGVDAPQPKRDVEGMLNNLVARAAKDTLKNPAGAIRTLNTYFVQRAWCQVEDKAARERIRNSFEAILARSYEKKKQYDKANEVRNVIEGEKKLFENSDKFRN